MLFILANTYMNLKELSERVLLSDNRTLLSWLDELNVPYQDRGRDKLIMLWDLEFGIQAKRAKRLKKSYPLRWHIIFEASLEDKNMVRAIFELVTPEYSTNKNTPNNGKNFIK